MLMVSVKPIAHSNVGGCLVKSVEGPNGIKRLITMGKGEGILLTPPV